jgi:hypothetical protein
VSAVASPTGTCKDCGKGIRQNKAGIWGARKRDDDHPWYCDASPDSGKHHEPEAEGTCTQDRALEIAAQFGGNAVQGTGWAA